MIDEITAPGNGSRFLKRKKVFPDEKHTFSGIILNWCWVREGR